MNVNYHLYKKITLIGGSDHRYQSVQVLISLPETPSIGSHVQCSGETYIIENIEYEIHLIENVCDSSHINLYCRQVDNFEKLKKDEF